MTATDEASTGEAVSESASREHRDRATGPESSPQSDAAEADRDGEGTVWYEDRLGQVVVGTYVVATLLGVLVAVRDAGSIPFVSTTRGAGVHPVPGYVFLYGFMGASAYGVTSLVSRDKSTREVIHLALRVVAALPLVLGVWALAPALGLGGNARAIAGVAFLAGLYVNLALEAFGSLAERLLNVPGN